MMMSWLLVMAAIPPAFSQTLEDPRLDPAVEEWLLVSGRVPVLVELDGGLAEARDAWRLINRALDSRYGQIEGPPNIRREFLVNVNRFGLVVLLSFDQVQSIHLPFEMTFP